MNKKSQYGYDVLGKYITVKLRVCLTQQNLEVLECTYKDWLCFYKTYSGYTRYIKIEGVLPSGSYDQFNHDLQLALVRTKIDKLKEQETRIVSDYLNIDRDIPNLDNPFIQANQDESFGSLFFTDIRDQVRYAASDEDYKRL